MRPQEFVIETLSHDGRGIARLNGKTIFIEGALPGETVTVRVTRQHRHYDEGCIETILTPSPQRVTPLCPHFSACGGCVLQHLEEGAQVSYKEQAFLQTLKRIGKIEPKTILPAITGNSWHYRHRARLHVQTLSSGISVGFKSKLDPKKVVNIHECPILLPDLEALLPKINAFIQTLSKPSRIQQILIAQGKEGIQILLDCHTSLPAADLALIQPFEALTQCSVFVERAAKTLSYPFPHLKHTLQFALTDFTQVNPLANEQMLAAVKEMMQLQADDRLADLYGGLGNFSVFIAPHVKQIIGAEFSQDMVHRAQLNAQQNHLTNCLYEQVDLEKPSQIQSFLKRYQINKVMMDPPRSGAKNLVEAIERRTVKGILYVSCHPGTLARDAAILVQQKKYRLMSVRVVDMFPQTGHIEAMAWFEG
jgi:23S rRNA (uracil1939-C5)-methyltransferase